VVEDGSADPRVTAALDAYAAGHGGEHAVLAALDASRLLVPVVAVPAGEDTPAPGGPRRGKSSEMALPAVIGADGRAALPAFTSAATLARWRAGARPVPVPAARVWQSGATDASAVVIDIAGPVPFAVDGARLAALAEGRPAPMPHEDPDVVALVRGIVTAETALAGFGLQPGRHGTDLTLCLAPGPTATQVQVRDAIERVSAGVMARAEGRVRRGIEVALTEAALRGTGRPEPGRDGAM